MFIIIGSDGKEYGPVPADKVRDWVAAGRANALTRIKRQGEDTWTTIGALPDFGATPAPSSPAPGAPAPLAASGGQPERPAPAGDASAIAADLAARAGGLDIFGCLGRSFELWKSHLLPLVGVTFVVMLAMMVLGVIPILGTLVNLVLTGVFYGGLYYFYLGKMRGEPREFADAFAGFSRAFGPLAVTTLLTVVLTAVAACVLLGPWILALVYSARDSGEPNLLLLAGAAVCALPLVYISVAWLFAYALVIDRGLSPWTAMEVSRRVISRQWFRVFFLVLLGGIIAMLGMIALFIGIFFTIPIAVGAMLYAYEDLCNPPDAAA